MAIVNCKECNKVFKKQYSPYCPPCHERHQAAFSQVYRFLQDKVSRGVTIPQLAKACGVPEKKIESMFFSGELGTASGKIIFNCQMCSVPTRMGINRKRVCPACAEKVEIEGKLIHPDERDASKRRSRRVVDDMTPDVDIPTGDHPKEPVTHPSVEVIPREQSAEQQSHEALNAERYGFKRGNG